MQKRIMLIIFGIVFLSTCGYLYYNQINTFNSRIDYLTDRYPFYECTMSWAMYKAWHGDQFINLPSLSWNGATEAASWNAFKAMLMDKEVAPSSMLYDPVFRVIWFDVVEYTYVYGIPVRAYYTTYYIQC